MSTLLLVTLLTVSMAAAPALAAEGTFAVGGNVGYSTLTGDDFENADPGFGADGFGRYMLENGFAIDAGFGWNSHGVTDTDDSVNIINAGIAPKYFFNEVHHIVKPFLGANAAWMQQSGTIADTDVKSTGFAFGAAGGAQFKVNEQFGIEATINYRALSFGDIDVDGTSTPDTDTSGGAFSFNTGFVYGF